MCTCHLLRALIGSLWDYRLDGHYRHLVAQGCCLCQWTAARVPNNVRVGISRVFKVRREDSTSESTWHLSAKNRMVAIRVHCATYVDMEVRSKSPVQGLAVDARTSTLIEAGFEMLVP